MKAFEFASKNKFNSVDTAIVNRLFGQEEKKEREWFLLLKGTINFDHSPYTAPPTLAKGVVKADKEEIEK